MSTQGGGPPNKWSVAKKIDGLSHAEVLTILNYQYNLGYNTVLYAPCADGLYLFFGNYPQ